MARNFGKVLKFGNLANFSKIVEFKTHLKVCSPMTLHIQIQLIPSLMLTKATIIVKCWTAHH